MVVRAEEGLRPTSTATTVGSDRPVAAASSTTPARQEALALSLRGHIGASLMRAMQGYVDRASHQSQPTQQQRQLDDHDSDALVNLLDPSLPGSLEQM